MLTVLHRLRIGQKIALGFALSMVLSCAIGGAGLFGLNSLGNAVTMTNISADALAQMNDAKASVAKFMSTHDEKDIAEAREMVDKVEHNLSDLGSRSDPRLASAFSTIDQFRTAAKTLEDASATILRVATGMDSAKQHLSQIASDVEKQATQQAAAMSKASRAIALRADQIRLNAASATAAGVDALKAGQAVVLFSAIYDPQFLVKAKALLDDLGAIVGELRTGNETGPFGLILDKLEKARTSSATLIEGLSNALDRKAIAALRDASLEQLATIQGAADELDQAFKTAIDDAAAESVGADAKRNRALKSAEIGRQFGNQAWNLLARALEYRVSASPANAAAFSASFATFAGATSDVAATGLADPTAEAKTFGERFSELKQASETLTEASDAIRNQVEGAVALLKKIADQRELDASKTGKLSVMGMIGALAIGLIIACMLVLLLDRLISTPIIRLNAAMRRLAEGDTDMAIQAEGRNDEIGQMAQTVVVFKENAVALRASERATTDARAVQDAQRRDHEQTRVQAAETQAKVVQALAEGLEALSGGNLRCRIGAAFPADYEKLRTDFNAAMDKLQDSMGVVSTNTAAIRSGAAEISTAADDLSRRTEQQAASLEQTAAALDEITATVKKTAQGATHAREVVSAAKADAEHSGTVVGRAMDAMTAIERSSKQVSQIIGVIDEIAFQTNLLALNAGVEAARAGDAGRGFAVVASEVRALAQRSAEAAKEIRGLISTSTAQVGEGVGLVDETGKSLARIAIRVAEISAIMVEIASSAQEQATGLDQVNTAVNQMDQVTQQNAAMVEQSTAASHGLSQEAEGLARLIERFEIGSSETRSSPARTAVASRLRQPAAIKLKAVG